MKYIPDHKGIYCSFLGDLQLLEVALEVGENSRNASFQNKAICSTGRKSFTFLCEIKCKTIS